MGVQIVLYLDDYGADFVDVEVSSGLFKKCEGEVSYEGRSVFSFDNGID